VSARGATPYAPRRRRPAVLRWVFLALLVVPIIEIAAIIAVGRVIGGWQTLALLIVESALGAWIVRREGSRTWEALNQALRSGRMPSRQLADAALVLIGGTLLLTPGFVTDIVGFFFILPLTRPVTRAWLEAAVARRLLGPLGEWPAPGTWPPAGAGGPGRGPQPRRAGPEVVDGEVIEGEVVDRDDT
jgi:UPF0716 protein FxsA